MDKTINISSIFSWVFAFTLFVIGVINVVLIHPVPGIAYFVLAFIYAPPTNQLLQSRFGFSIPLAVKVILFVAIVMFTLGVSDLGDMVDDWVIRS
ncbi:hypothetical protein [Sabulibacter ruber]|uniref:hypothetical protein n=1 Tax=Sabulibacter ruber TaxID=2811901 RepID=UPI001A979EE1|nr:hypothetical protein [Sabulibacter ruber]